MIHSFIHSFIDSYCIFLVAVAVGVAKHEKRVYVRSCVLTLGSCENLLKRLVVVNVDGLDHKQSIKNHQQ